ncbi:MAG: gamma-glutamyltransferase [Pseudomonadota bacterium]|nr:gamma-glutamyltransferase [Pseudomonadota bacterium]
MKNFLITIFLILSFLTNFVEASDHSKSIVVTSNPYASKAAAEILRNGGSAVDAAITAQFVLTLTQPQSTGIGGGAFMLYWDQSSGKLYALDGREKAPASASPQLFLNKDGRPRKFYPDAVVGGISVGVPGMMRFLEQAHKKFGKLEWAFLLEYPIRLAEEGFELSPSLYRTLSFLPDLKKIEPASSYFYKDNRNGELTPLPIGTILTNTKYAKTLKRIAKFGPEEFYSGKTANLIINAVNNSPFSPGLITLEDLANYTAVWRDPICGLYREYKVCSMPPPTSGGITMLMMLKMLERFDIESEHPNSANFIHLFSEAGSLAYADRDYYIADPDFVDIPVNGMLNEDYILGRSKLIKKETSLRDRKPGKPKGYTKFSKNVDISRPSTSHLVIVDNFGNSISLTSTIEGPFGSHLMAGGFMLNNELTDFSLIPKKNGLFVANRVEANKRPRSSMTPTIIFNPEGEIYALTGSPGGNSIIGYVTKSVMAMIDWDLSPQDTVSLPHFMRKGENTELERGTDIVRYKQFLEKKGHKVVVIPKVSGLQIVKKKNKGFIGGTDPRGEGLVIPIEK